MRKRSRSRDTSQMRDRKRSQSPSSRKHYDEEENRITRSFAKDHSITFISLNDIKKAPSRKNSAVFNHTKTQKIDVSSDMEDNAMDCISERDYQLFRQKKSSDQPSVFSQDTFGVPTPKLGGSPQLSRDVSPKGILKPRTKTHEKEVVIVEPSDVDLLELKPGQTPKLDDIKGAIIDFKDHNAIQTEIRNFITLMVRLKHWKLKEIIPYLEKRLGSSVVTHFKDYCGQVLRSKNHRHAPKLNKHFDTSSDGDYINMNLIETKQEEAMRRFHQEQYNATKKRIYEQEEILENKVKYIQELIDQHNQKLYKDEQVYKNVDAVNELTHEFFDLKIQNMKIMENLQQLEKRKPQANNIQMDLIRRDLDIAQDTIASHSLQMESLMNDIKNTDQNPNQNPNQNDIDKLVRTVDAQQEQIGLLMSNVDRLDQSHLTLSEQLNNNLANLEFQIWQNQDRQIKMKDVMNETLNAYESQYQNYIQDSNDRFNLITNDIGELKETHETRLDLLQEQVNSHDAQILENETGLSKLKTEMTEAQQAVKNIDHNMAKLTQLMTIMSRDQSQFQDNFIKGFQQIKINSEQKMEQMNTKQPLPVSQFHLHTPVNQKSKVLVHTLGSTASTN